MRDLTRDLLGETALDETLDPEGWRAEWEVLLRRRKSVLFILAAVVLLGVFYTSPWAWVIYFAILAAYSALWGVRMGLIVGASFCIWFIVGIQGWLSPTSTAYEAIGLWCVASLFLLVVWKADDVHLLHGRWANGDREAPQPGSTP